MTWGHEDDEREQREGAEFWIAMEALADERGVDLDDDEACAALASELWSTEAEHEARRGRMEP